MTAAPATGAKTAAATTNGAKRAVRDMVSSFGWEAQSPPGAAACLSRARRPNCQRGDSRSGADQGEHLVALRFHLRLRERFEVQPQQRLGVRRPYVEVPVVELDGDA